MSGLPLVGSSEALRFAADVIELTASPDLDFPEYQKRDAEQLRAEAVRVEREEVVAGLAEVLTQCQVREPTRDVAEHLLKFFNVTIKDEL